MLCSGEKTKLIIVSTKEQRNSKLEGKTMHVKVGDNTILESTDEKLLGITMSNNLSWNTYLYGNKKTGSEKLIGLIPKLSQRIGMLSKIDRYVSRKQFKMMCDGLRGVPTGGVWGGATPPHFFQNTELVGIFTSLSASVRIFTSLMH